METILPTIQLNIIFLYFNKFKHDKNTLQEVYKPKKLSLCKTEKYQYNENI